MVIQIHINIAFCDDTFDDSVSRFYKMFLRSSPYMQCGWWKMFVLIAASNMSFITPAIQFTSSSAQLIILGQKSITRPKTDSLHLPGALPRKWFRCELLVAGSVDIQNSLRTPNLNFKWGFLYTQKVSKWVLSPKENPRNDEFHSEKRCWRFFQTHKLSLCFPDNMQSYPVKFDVLCGIFSLRVSGSHPTLPRHQLSLTTEMRKATF